MAKSPLLESSPNGISVDHSISMTYPALLAPVIVTHSLPEWHLLAAVTEVLAVTLVP